MDHPCQVARRNRVDRRGLNSPGGHMVRRVADRPKQVSPAAPRGNARASQVPDCTLGLMLEFEDSFTRFHGEDKWTK